MQKSFIVIIFYVGYNSYAIISDMVTLL